MRALAVVAALAAVARADTAPPVPKPPGQARVIVHADRLEVLDHIYFETAKAVIKPISYPILDEVAAVLKANPAIALLEIQGHSDERGDDAHNLKLTDERAQAVRIALVGRGVAADRLRASGQGETRPLCREHNEACWSRNRRIEWQILKRLP